MYDKSPLIIQFCDKGFSCVVTLLYYRKRLYGRLIKTNKIMTKIESWGLWRQILYVIMLYIKYRCYNFYIKYKNRIIIIKENAEKKRFFGELLFFIRSMNLILKRSWVMKKQILYIIFAFSLLMIKLLIKIYWFSKKWLQRIIIIIWKVLFNPGWFLFFNLYFIILFVYKTFIKKYKMEVLYLWKETSFYKIYESYEVRIWWWDYTKSKSIFILGFSLNKYRLMFSIFEDLFEIEKKFINICLYWVWKELKVLIKLLIKLYKKKIEPIILKFIKYLLLINNLLKDKLNININKKRKIKEKNKEIIKKIIYKLLIEKINYMEEKSNIKKIKISYSEIFFISEEDLLIKNIVNEYDLKLWDNYNLKFIDNKNLIKYLSINNYLFINLSEIYTKNKELFIDKIKNYKIDNNNAPFDDYYKIFDYNNQKFYNKIYFLLKIMKIFISIESFDLKMLTYGTTKQIVSFIVNYIPTFFLILTIYDAHYDIEDNFLNKLRKSMYIGLNEKGKRIIEQYNIKLEDSKLHVAETGSRTLQEQRDKDDIELGYVNNLEDSIKKLKYDIRKVASYKIIEKFKFYDYFIWIENVWKNLIILKKEIGTYFWEPVKNPKVESLEYIEKPMEDNFREWMHLLKFGYDLDLRKIKKYWRFLLRINIYNNLLYFIRDNNKYNEKNIRYNKNDRDYYYLNEYFLMKENLGIYKKEEKIIKYKMEELDNSIRNFEKDYMLSHIEDDWEFDKLKKAFNKNLEYKLWKKNYKDLKLKYNKIVNEIFSLLEQMDLSLILAKLNLNYLIIVKKYKKYEGVDYYFLEKIKKKFIETYGLVGLVLSNFDYLNRKSIVFFKKPLYLSWYLNKNINYDFLVLPIFTFDTFFKKKDIYIRELYINCHDLYYFKNNVGLDLKEYIIRNYKKKKKKN